MKCDSLKMTSGNLYNESHLLNMMEQRFWRDLSPWTQYKVGLKTHHGEGSVIKSLQCCHEDLSYKTITAINKSLSRINCNKKHSRQRKEEEMEREPEELTKKPRE